MEVTPDLSKLRSRTRMPLKRTDLQKSLEIMIPNGRSHIYLIGHTKNDYRFLLPILLLFLIGLLIFDWTPKPDFFRLVRSSRGLRVVVDSEAIVLTWALGDSGIQQTPPLLSNSRSFPSLFYREKLLGQIFKVVSCSR